MNKEFLINLFFLIFANLLIKPFYIFGIDREVQILVGNQYGLYFELLNFSLILQIFTDFGVQQYAGKHIAQRPFLLSKYLGYFIQIKLLLLFIFIFCSLTLAYCRGFDAEAMNLLYFLLANQVMITAILFIRMHIAALQYYRWDSILSIMDKTILSISCAFLLYSSFRNDFSIKHFVQLQSLSYLITFTLAGFILYKKTPPPITWKWRPLTLWVILKQSFPYALTVFLMTSYTRIDALMIGQMRLDGKEENELYAAGFRMLDLCNMFCFLFINLLYPMFARLIKEKKDVESLLILSLQLLLAIAIGLSISSFFFQEEFMQLLYYSKYTLRMGQIFGLLILSFIPLACIFILNALLVINNQLHNMNRVFFFSLIFNVLLNAVMIPTKGAMGAAITTLLTQCFVAACLFYLSQKSLNLNQLPQFFQRCILFSLLVLGINIFSQNYLDFFWFYEFVLIGMLTIVFSILTKMINIPSILKNFKSKPI